MKYMFTRENESIFPIEKMCRVLHVSFTSYYKYKRRGLSNRELKKKEIHGQTRSIYFAKEQHYGSPRITAELRSSGYAVSRVSR